MSCPDLVLLSQFLDGELLPAEADLLARHTEGCATCGIRLERLQRSLAETADAARTESVAEPARRADCPAPSALAGWRDPAVPSAERLAVASHLEKCDACLADVIGAARLLARLDTMPSIAVPAALRSHVDAQLALGSEGKKLSRLVVRVAKAGVELIENQLLAPLRELVLVTSPIPALRSNATATGLSFELRAPNTVIKTTLLPAGEHVALTLTLTDDAGLSLKGQRVHLRRQGRSLYSARTDDSGTLRMPSVERGVYEVACPGLAVAFRLDLQA